MATKLPEVIDNVGRCRQVVDILSREMVLGVDCEGISLGVEGPLTLIQVGNCSGEVYLFDILKNKELLSKGKLGDLLESDNTVKVMHACSNDSAALYYQFKVTLKNVFDTQVASLVIQEHKGRRLAPLLKLAVVCEEYSGKPFSSGIKADVQTEWMKETGDLWAKRPMTEDMILYAAGDVIAIVPEVYENQKRYLEKHHLLKKFEERVKEEIFYTIDPKLRQTRRERVEAIVEEIITDMKAKCSENTSLNDLEEDGDEIRALQRMDYREAAKISPQIDRLKTALIRKELSELSEKLDREGDDFIPALRSKGRFIGYEKHSDRLIGEAAKKVNKRLNDVALKDICRKYNMTTSLSHLRQMEKETLRSLRPSGSDDPDFPAVALRLYWMLMEDDLDKKIAEFKENGKDFKIAEGYYRKMRFYIARRTRVPQSIKRKAKMLKDKMDETFGHDVIPS